MSLSVSEITLRVTASGATVAPAAAYDFLATYGILFLSFGEWIRVLGAAYIASLLIKTVYQLIMKFIER